MADVLDVFTDGLAVVEKRPVGVEEGARPVGQRVVVQMEQLAIVLDALRVLFVQVGTAQELVLHRTGTCASLFVAGLEIVGGNSGYQPRRIVV